jgi:transforming growth factor-beta-induced protein
MSRTYSTRFFALVAVVLLVSSACGGADETAVIYTGNNPVTAPRDIVDTAVAAELSTLVAAVGAAEITDDLRADGPLTVFAPTDAAFEALPPGLIDLLLEPRNRGLLTDILTYHVASGLLTSAELIEASPITTLEGGTLRVAEVTIPSDDDSDPTLEVRVNDEATIVAADQLATNGIVHVIDTVLVPADRADDLADLIDSIPEVLDIVATAEAAGTFSTLLEALDDAGLTDTLEGPGPFTVFAPTNAAFNRLTPAQQAALQDPEVLEAVLRFHVLAGEIRTDSILTERLFTTLEGQGARLARVITRTEVDEDDADDPEVEVTVEFTFAGVRLQVTDIEATNGVIHVIDTVLVPDSARGPGGL